MVKELDQSAGYFRIEWDGSETVAKYEALSYPASSLVDAQYIATLILAKYSGITGVRFGRYNEKTGKYLTSQLFNVVNGQFVKI